MAAGSENFDAWADLDGSSTITTRRMYGAGFDDATARVSTGGAVAWYGTDRLGSVRKVLDNSGSVIASSDFDAFGNLTAGSLSDRYGFTGREWDTTLSGYDYRRRIYVPSVGRFFSEDPMGFGAGDANLFRYVGNATTLYTDPSGLDADGAGGSGGPAGGQGLPTAHASEVEGAIPGGPPGGGGYGDGSNGGGPTTAGSLFAFTPLGMVYNAYTIGSESIRGWQLDKEFAKKQGKELPSLIGHLGQDALMYGKEALVGGKVGLKAKVNAVGHTIQSTFTLGITDGDDWWEVTDEDRANGYDVSYGFQRVGYELLVMVIPGLGQIKGATWAIRGIRGAIKGFTYLDKVTSAVTAGRGAYDAYQNGLSLENSLMMLGGVGSKGVLQPLQNTALNRGVSNLVHGTFGNTKLHGALSAIGDFAGFKVCFAAGTPLRTPDGSRAIEELRPGDLVLSRDEHDPAGPVVAKAVEEVFVRHGLVWHLHVGGQVIRTTAEHPFYAHGRGWTACQELQVGDWLLCEDGRWAAVEDLLDTGCWETVYNLRVADYHTYFVGTIEWDFATWAHNAYFGPRRWSEMVRNGGLAVFEALGGHTLARHVGRTAQQLRDRLAAEPWITAASTFYNRRIAELAISRAIAAHSSQIAAWLASGTNAPLRIVVNTGHNIGRSLQPGHTGSRHVQSVRVILIRDPSHPLGYRILTAYPQP